MIQSHAMAWRRYMHQYGATREHLATFVVNSRRNANLNPRAFFYTKPMTRDDYFAARRSPSRFACSIATCRSRAASRW